MESALRLRFIVNGVETDDALKEDMQFGVGRRISRHLEEGLEYVYSSLY